MVTLVAVPLGIFAEHDTAPENDSLGLEVSFQVIRVIRKTVENLGRVVRTTFWAAIPIRFHFAEPSRKYECRSN